MSTDNRRLSSSRVYRRLLAGVPWWIALLLAIAALAVGVVITFRPFTSLGVLVGLVAAAFLITGLSEIASPESGRTGWIGGAWIVGGIGVAVWPGLTVHGVAILVGIVLLVGGLLRIAAGIRGSADERVISAVSGLARSIFGILALSWPDVTILVVALLVGPAMIVFGIGQAASAVRRLHGSAAPPMGRRPRWLRTIGGGLSLLFALLLLLVSALIHRSSAAPSAFYTAPSTVPSRPGVLLRSEPFTTGIPGTARAWRILYTTTRADGVPAIASGVVVVPKTVPSGPRPVIAWAHGTTGFASGCAPSLVASGLPSGALPDLDQVIANGWILVATDYVGLGTKGPHPYLIGEPEARSVLDSVRAARQVKSVDLQKRTVVWGHSQGGGAALWTGIIAPTYAPDVNVIGVAALSPATELLALFERVKDTPVGKIMGSYALSAYSATYPDVHFDDYVRPGARVLARQTAARCLSGPEALVSVAAAGLGNGPWFSKSPAAGPLGKRLEQNIPLGHIAAPLMIAQGLSDSLVVPNVQQRYVSQLCKSGQSLEYRTYQGFDHVSIVTNPSSPLLPDLIAWTKARLAGTPQKPVCITIRR